MENRQIDTRTVDTVVADIVQRNGWEKQLEMYSVFIRWETLVSADIWHHCRPVRIDRDILWLEVENSGWMAQLQYEKYGMLEAVNAILRLGRFRDIKMALPKTEQGFVLPRRTSGPRVVYDPPTEEEIAVFRQKLDGLIDDDACREGLEEFWYLAHACRRLDQG